MDTIVRPYRVIDRQRIRTIACDTADKGEPVEGFFGDREIVADFVTRFYTDYARNSLWVAENDGLVVGYLSGCFDTSRYNHIMLRCLFPRIILKAIFRGVFFRRDTWQMLYAFAKTFLLFRFKKETSLDKYPAHLHINIGKSFRRQDLGHRLMAQFIDEVKKRKIKGIHLSTRADNTAACRFFEQFGFVEVDRHPTVFPRYPFQIIYIVVYGMEI